MLYKTVNSYLLIVKNLIFAALLFFLLHYNQNHVILQHIFVQEMVTCCLGSGDLVLCALLFLSCKKHKQ